MKFNFFNKLFRSKQDKSTLQNDKKIENPEEFYDFGLTQDELLCYDKNVNFYYTNIINSLILYTYDTKQLDDMAPILIDPFAELYEELDYAFLPILFESVFRNKLIDENLKEELLMFKKKVDEIPVELWDWEILDTSEIWKEIRINAEGLLNKLNIETRVYNTEYTTILFNK